MKYKTYGGKDELANAHPKLQKLVEWVDNYCKDKFNKEVTVTGVDRTRQESIDIYIKQINPKTGKLYLPEEVVISTHETNPCRAADLRSSDFTHDQCLGIQYAVNTNWVYNPDRPDKKCLLYHKVGTNAFHLHLQITDKTELVS